LATIRLSQQKLKEDVEQLARRLVERGVAGEDSNMAKIAEILPRAAAAMDTAEKALGSSKLKDALQPEQRALLHLQRAEAVFRDIRVSMGNEGGGGGGGGGGPQAEDLADLFELQRERMRNQYETVQRAQQEEQQADQQVDAAAERLKQLAARQQQENERARRKADSMAVGASGSSGGDSQRQLAQQVEEAARQLERLAREQESRSLADAARRLNEAADAMRRSAASNGQRSAQDAQAALDRLKDARRLLDQERENRVQRSVEDAANTARRLQEEQRKVAEDVARQESVTGQQREELQRSIEQRKGAMADSVKSLATRLDRAALDGRREQPKVARELEEAADTLRNRRIEDKLRITQNSVRDTPQSYQNTNERVISGDIDRLNQALEEARVAARNSRASDKGQQNADAMDRARELVRGMESLDERRRQQQEAQGQQNQGQNQGQQNQGQEGRQGQQGQGQSREGQQNAQGQRGQQGGQGQGSQGQEGQQGNQGQRGQDGQQGGGGQPGQANSQGGGGGRQLGDGGRPGGTGGYDRSQYNRELQERLNDARALRRELQRREGVDLGELDRAIERMENLGRAGGGSYSDPRAERELRAQVVEGLRSFEFQLGQVLGERAGERVLVDRSGEVPPEYRKYVEEYYRSLGRAKQKP
jgi:hypothetical protein